MGVIGSLSPVVEAALLAVGCEVLRRIGFQDLVVRLNDRQLLTALMESFDVSPDQYGDVLIAIDKMDKIGVEGVQKELTARGIDQMAAASMLRTFGSFLGDDNAFEELDRLVRGGPEGGVFGMRRLREIL